LAITGGNVPAGFFPEYCRRCHDRSAVFV